MNDPNIIKQIEKKIDKKLKNSYRAWNGYVLNKDKQVTSLSLNQCNIQDLYMIITDLAQLNSLKNLSLSYNYLEDISPLKELKYIQELNLSSNKITDLAPLKNLLNLINLNISSNGTFFNLSPLKNLLNLTNLNIGNSEIYSDLSPLKNLKKLTNLRLYACRTIKDISSLNGLINLTELSLGYNVISDLSPIRELTNLKVLDLIGNQISDIDPLKEIKTFETLRLAENKIEVIPYWITNLSPEIKLIDGSRWTDGVIDVINNPVKSPPIEIIKKGKEAIKEWFKGERIKVNEVKVLLVGHGEVGKTTLIKCLKGEKPDRKEKSTHHININAHYVHWKGQDIKLNFWDFGGQEVMHSTHQFFLSSRSIYILVLDGRKDEDAEYWLKHIESFGGDSPVLIVLNKMDTNPGYDVNRQFLREKYPFIKDFYKTACFSRKKGVKELMEGLISSLGSVQILKEEWPHDWAAVKNILEEMEDDFISQVKYEEICEQNKIRENTAKETLAGFLNDLGVVVHFKDMRLRNLHILQPRWASRAAYKIINSKKVAKNYGLLKEEWLPDIMKKQDKNDFQYDKSTFPYILDLMQKFELCFSIDSHQYLIPELMDIQQPPLPKHEGAVLKFYFEYKDLMPRSILSRFIVRMHEDIKADLRWRTGVVLTIPSIKTMAIVIADVKEKRIHISVSGPRRREHFAIIRNTFHSLHKIFEKLIVKEWIPLPPPHENDAVEYGELTGLEEMKKDKIDIGRLGVSFAIKDLLDGIESESIRKDEYKWDAFLCHSSKDKNLLENIGGDFEKKGISYWLDDKQIDPGDNIIDKITEGLLYSRCIIPCISTSQLKSGWCRNEYQSMLNKIISGTTKQRIIPFILDDTSDNEIPMLLNNYRQERYTDKTQYERLLKFLQSRNK